MKNLKGLLLALVLALALPLGVSAQTALNSTTLNEAVDGTETSIDLASAANINARDIAFVDHEAMRVVSVDATNNRIVVIRGYAGTLADDHANSAFIYIDRPDRFISKDLTGSCTAGSEFPNFTPLINISNGKQYICSSSLWLLVLSTGSITPAATPAAVGVDLQTFTLNGVLTGQALMVAVQPAPTALCPLVSVRASAANTVQLGFATLTAAACTPAAGTYLFFVP